MVVGGLENRGRRSGGWSVEGSRPGESDELRRKRDFVACLDDSMVPSENQPAKQVTGAPSFSAPMPKLVTS